MSTSTSRCAHYGLRKPLAVAPTHSCLRELNFTSNSPQVLVA
jgi:hypothetical protein